MNDFKTSYADFSAFDPYKRVNYTPGLVLGADEFVQEELYLLEKHQLHNRALHGYGTVCGLSISWRHTDNGPEIRVAPGIAVNPKGQEIRVSQTQCALLNVWLERNKESVQTSLGSPPQHLQLYVVLCYDECKTDQVPIPSGPCISIEDSSAPSRIADAFALRLVQEDQLPDQIENKKLHSLIDLLHQIEISNAPGDFLTKVQLENLVRNLREPETSPPAPSPPVLSPPISMRIHPSDVRAFFQAAFRVWVTEVRPYLLEAGRNCAGGPPMENCVLLAEIEFDVQEAGSLLLVSGDVTIDQTDRPILLNTRLFQEYVTVLCVGRQLP